MWGAASKNPYPLGRPKEPAKQMRWIKLSLWIADNLVIVAVVVAPVALSMDSGGESGQ